MRKRNWSIVAVLALILSGLFMVASYRSADASEAPVNPASSVVRGGAGTIMVHMSPDDGFDGQWPVKCYPNGAQRSLSEGQSSQAVCGSGAINAFFVAGGTKIVCTDGRSYGPVAWHNAGWVYEVKYCVNQLINTKH